MRRDETIKILTVIKLTYPNAFKRTNADDFRMMIDAWNTVFAEYNYEDVNTGLLSFMRTDTSGFPPSVGQIIGMMPSVRNNETVTLNALEAWALVAKAIRNSNYHSVEEYDALPPLVQKAVGNPATLQDWAAMDSGVVHSVEQSNFMRTYEALVKRAKDDVKLPPELRLALEGTKTEVIEDKAADKEEQTQRPSAEEIDRMMQELGARFKEASK